MKTIYKYSLPLAVDPVVEMQRGAHILDIQTQHDGICIWAVVEPTEQLEKRRFFIVGTGHPMPLEAGAYLRTVQQGSFVWHVFEERMGSTPRW